MIIVRIVQQAILIIGDHPATIGQQSSDAESADITLTLRIHVEIYNGVTILLVDMKTATTQILLNVVLVLLAKIGTTPPIVPEMVIVEGHIIKKEMSPTWIT